MNLDGQDWAGLSTGLTKAGANPDEAIPRLRRYADILVSWNNSVSNIMSRNDHDRIVERHLRECLDPAHTLKASGVDRLIDFGSGAGFPAIPLAIAGIGSRWTLVESRRSKVLFLTRAVGELGLAGVDVVHSRLETVALEDDRRGKFDAFTSRATAAIPETLAMAKSLVRDGGFAFLWGGTRREADLVADESWASDWSLESTTNVTSGLTAMCKFAKK